MKPKLT